MFAFLPFPLYCTGFLLPVTFHLLPKNTTSPLRCPEALLKFKSKQNVLPFSLSLFLFLLLCSLSQQRANLLNDRLRSCLFLNSFPLLVPSIRPYLLLSRPFHQPPTNPCHRSFLLQSILHMVLSMVILKTFITVYVYLSSAERSLWAPYCL